MGDGGGRRAIETLQISAVQGVGLQEAIHTRKGGATDKIIDLHSIAIEVAATSATFNGRIISPLGEHSPTPAIHGIARIRHCAWDRCQAPRCCFAVGDLIHHKAAGQQPIGRGRRFANGPTGWLAQGHEASPIGIGIGLHLGPEFNSVWSGGQPRGRNQDGSFNILTGIDAVCARAVGWINRVDGRNDCAGGDARTADLITHIQMALGERNNRQQRVRYGASERANTHIWRANHASTCNRLAGIKGIAARTIAGIAWSDGRNDCSGGYARATNHITNIQTPLGQRCYGKRGGCDAVATSATFDRAREQGNRIGNAGEIAGGDVVEDLANGAVSRAHARGQHAGAIAVLNGACLGGGKGPLDCKGEPRIRGDSGRCTGVFCRPNIDGIHASLQLSQVQINRRLIVENTFAVGSTHILAPTDHWSFNHRTIRTCR